MSARYLPPVDGWVMLAVFSAGKDRHPGKTPGGWLTEESEIRTQPRFFFQSLTFQLFLQPRLI